MSKPGKGLFTRVRPTLRGSLSTLLTGAIGMALWHADQGHFDTVLSLVGVMVIMFVMRVALEFNDGLARLLKLYADFQSIRYVRPTKEQIDASLQELLDQEEKKKQ